MNTAPRSVDCVSIPAKRSPVLAASVLTASSCDSPRRLIPRNGRSFSLGHVVDEFCTQNDTSGGSNDLGTKVLAARPPLAPSTSAAIAITPEGKYPNASRSADGLKSVRVIATPSSHALPPTSLLPPTPTRTVPT